jgi:hypothetical protein
MARPGAHEVQLDLFLDYASNVEMYPKFQEYFRQHRPSLLAVWGSRDPFFVPAGAEAFKRDIKNAKVMCPIGRRANRSKRIPALLHQTPG